MSDLCPHGDLQAACIDCLTGVPPERPNSPPGRLEVASHPFASRFSGHCAGCNLEIHEGQTIVRMDDDSHRHSDCGTR